MQECLVKDQLARPENVGLKMEDHGCCHRLLLYTLQDPHNCEDQSLSIAVTIN